MLIIDRFEGEYAVCEDQDTLNAKKLPRVLLPQGTREGDCLVLEAGEWKLNAAETLRRRKEAQESLNMLYR